jgi:hypothetical protein
MFLGRRALPVLKADNFTAIGDPIFYKMWDYQHLTTL